MPSSTAWSTSWRQNFESTASGLMKDVPEIEGVPVVLLSALPEEMVQVHAAEAGAAGYLLKPYRSSVLLECVKRFTHPALRHTA